MSKSISIRDVALAAQVSSGTVSNYLNQSAPVNTETGKRIQAAIEQLGYRRNLVASSLRRNQTNTIGMIVPAISNPFYTAMFMYVEKEMQRHDYTITLGTTRFDKQRIAHYLDIFQHKQVDGIILESSTISAIDHPPESYNTPIVVISPADKNIWSSIHIDTVAAVRELIDHLVSLGHRRIANLVPDPPDKRLIGYKLALIENGLSVDENLIVYAGRYQSDLMEQGANAINELLAQHKPGVDFTACFCHNDMMAMGAMQELKAQGYRIPEDVALVGFDDIPFVRLLDPPLTTIAQPIEGMGYLAVELLLKHVQDPDLEPKHIILPHKLVIRESTLTS